MEDKKRFHSHFSLLIFSFHYTQRYKNISHPLVAGYKRITENWKRWNPRKRYHLIVLVSDEVPVDHLAQDGLQILVVLWIACFGPRELLGGDIFEPGEQTGAQQVAERKGHLALYVDKLPICLHNNG